MAAQGLGFVQSKACTACTLYAFSELVLAPFSPRQEKVSICMVALIQPSQLKAEVWSNRLEPQLAGWALSMVTHKENLSSL